MLTICWPLTLTIAAVSFGEPALALVQRRPGPGRSELDLIRSSGARVHVAVMEGRPCMVLATLLETFGVSSPRLCVNVSLLPFFSACGVSGDLSSEEAALIKSRTEVYAA